jgi:F0F1-type ATP synthase membrane subunit c/vacuolar-type H+-ATPase subunit K
MRSILKNQRGLAFGQFLMIAILLVIVAIFGMKVIPAYIENRSIAHTLDTLARDPELQAAPPAKIRDRFDRNATMSDIKSITAEQIEISQTPQGDMVLRAKYNVKIPLGGNLYLLIEFDTSSSRPK